MFKLLKESFKRTNKSIILAVPLVIFVLLAELYFSIMHIEIQLFILPIIFRDIPQSLQMSLHMY